VNVDRLRELIVGRQRPCAWTCTAVAGVLFGVAIRFRGLGKQSLWFDEGYTAWMVSHPPAEIIRLIRADTAPPLYYLLLRVWTDLFGHSEVALRSMSTVLSSLTLLLGVIIARRFVREWALALIAWVLALGFMSVEYSQEARAYALMAFCFVAAIECLLRYLATGAQAWLGCITLLLAAGLYTHNMMAPYVLAFAGAWFLFRSELPLKRRLVDFCIVMVAVGVFYAPWAVMSLGTQIAKVHQGFWVARPTSRIVLDLLAELSGFMHFWSWDWVVAKFTFGVDVGLFVPAFAVVILLGACWLSLVQQRGSERRDALALLLLGLGPPFLVAIYSRFGTSLLMDKVFVPSATLVPIFLLFPLRDSVNKVVRRATVGGAIAILLVTAGTLYGYRHEESKEDWRGAAAAVESLGYAKRLVVFVGEEGELPFDYYYQYNEMERVTGVPAGFFDLDPPVTMLRARSDANLLHLRSLIGTGKYDQIVVVLSHENFADPDGRTMRMLTNQFKPAGDIPLRLVRVVWFDVRAPRTNQ
jgi:4-amino-4-deoxy-L-arabinose transferase-like glycosyltransferase